MNISPQNADLPLVNVANQATASLRRDNQQRDLITRPEPSAQSGAEKGVASDADKSQTPGQNVDFRGCSFCGSNVRREQDSTACGTCLQQFASVFALQLCIF